MIIVELSASSSVALPQAVLADYFPSAWAIVDAKGGQLTAAGDWVRIEWPIGDLGAGATVTRAYVLSSPALESPPADYAFYSRLESPAGQAQSDLWPVKVADPAPTGAQNLHAADAVVGGTTYNTVNANALAGTLVNATASIGTRRVDQRFSDGGIAIWVSDPVPSGKQWTLGSNWTFDLYVKASASNSARVWFKAEVYRIGSGGAATNLHTTAYHDPGLNGLPTATYQRITWSVTSVPSSVIAAGERIGVAFVVYVDNNEAPGVSAQLGFDHSSAPSNVTMSVTESTATGTKQARFRIGNDDGDQSTHTWKAATDTTPPAGSVLAGERFRVRFQVYRDAGTSLSFAPRIEVATSTAGPWTALPTSSGTPPFFVADTPRFANGASITSPALGTGTGTWQNGYAYDTVNPPAAWTQNATSYTELEYSLQPSANAVVGTTYYFRLTNNGTALTEYQVYASVVFGPAGGTHQAHFRIGNDDGPPDNHTWKAATDTAAPAGTVLAGEKLRVRFQVYNDAGTAFSWQPRLEVATSTGGPWAALPTAAGADPFFVADTIHFANGDPITAAALGAGTGAWQNGVAYDTVNPPGTAWVLNGNSYTEVEFSLQATSNAVAGSTYYFRLTNSGSALTSYQVYASLVVGPAPNARQEHFRIGDDAPLASMTWKAGTDTTPPAGTILAGANFRVRFQVGNDSGTAYTWQPRIEYATTSGGPWTALPTAATSTPFFVADTPRFANGDPITAAALGAGTGAWQNGVAYDTVNPPGTAWVLNGNSYTEVEFSLQATSNGVQGATYYFRLTDNGTALGGYLVYASVVFGSPPPTPTPAPPAHNLNQWYGPDTAACAGCHRAHTARGREALRKAWPEEQVCYICHDGTTAAPNIRAEFQKTYRMPIAQTEFVHRTAEARTGASFSGANRHVECEDCHNPHEAGGPTHTFGTNLAAGPLQGVWGVRPTTWPAAWAEPDQTAGYQTTNRVTYEYELCFKCHSNWAYGGSPPASPSLGAAQTNQAREFNPNNASYHPVVQAGKNPFQFPGGGSYASSLLNGLTPSSTLVCSDCHASESDASPKGPHGSANPFILRGTWARDTRQGPVLVDANTLCFRCHDPAVYRGYDGGGPGANRTGFSGGGKNLHLVMVGARNKAYGDRAIVCMDCHSAVPHGVNRDHLIALGDQNGGDGFPYVQRPYTGGLTVIDTWQQAGQWTRASCGTAMDGPNGCR